jgi:hypothetical protein
MNVVKLMKKAKDSGEVPISSVKGLEGSALTEAMKIFEKFLYSVNLENSLYRSLTSSRLARQVNQKASRLFLSDFRFLLACSSLLPPLRSLIIVFHEIEWSAKLCFPRSTDTNFLPQLSQGPRKKQKHCWELTKSERRKIKINK